MGFSDVFKDNPLGKQSEIIILGSVVGQFSDSIGGNLESNFIWRISGLLVLFSISVKFISDGSIPNM